MMIDEFHLPTAAECWREPEARPPRPPGMWTEAETAAFLRVRLSSLRDNRAGLTKVPTLTYMRRDDGAVFYDPEDVKAFMAKYCDTKYYVGLP